MNVDQFMGHLAERCREEAVRVLRRALERGGGQLAQFSHPELGGYGQWMPGMTQIGDMFNYELRDRVERLCQELNDPSHGEHEPMLASFSEGPAAPALGLPRVLTEVAATERGLSECLYDPIRILRVVGRERVTLAPMTVQQFNFVPH